jgi:hypothetical protein
MMKEYIGDGVYVDESRGMIRLTAENGESITNTIYLEVEVWEALCSYVARFRDAPSIWRRKR